MSARKMAGLFLIIMGLVQIFQVLSEHAPPGRASGTLHAFVTALLFSLGAALIWWNGKSWNKDSHTHD